MNYCRGSRGNMPNPAFSINCCLVLKQKLPNNYKSKIRKYHQQKACQITNMRNNKGPNTEPCEPALGNFQFEE